MRIGHIYLQGRDNGVSEYFVRLIEGLAAHGVQQHVVADRHEISARVKIAPGVSVGPCTSSAIVAMALMPQVSLVHAHDDDAGRAGLLLKLTRSMRFVITRRSTEPLTGSPVLRAMYERAEFCIARSDEAARSLSDAGIKTRTEVLKDLDAETAELGAAEHIRVYRRALDRSTVPMMLL